MKLNVFGLNPKKQSILILTMGLVITFIIIWGATNGFEGGELPTQ